MRLQEDPVGEASAQSGDRLRGSPPMGAKPARRTRAYASPSTPTLIAHTVLERSSSAAQPARKLVHTARGAQE